MPNMNGKFFDAHCHVFNLEYLFLELGQIAWDHLIGVYPKNSDFKLTKAAGSPIDKIGEFIKWLIQVSSAALGSEEANTKFIFDTAKTAFKKDICITPLMMDIYYMFYPPVQTGVAKLLSKLAPLQFYQPQNKPEELLDRFFNDVIAANQDQIKKADEVIKKINASQPGNEMKDIETMLRNTSAEIIKQNTALKLKSAEYSVTLGFQHEIDTLTALQKKYPDRVFPFLAVDPRRKGLIDYICKGNLVNKTGGPFYGIKLYPQLGYRPDISEFSKLYDYCDKNRIPITTHSSFGGFPSCFFRDWAYCKFGDPKNYSGLFQKYGSLKINMAHFGDSGTNTPWADTIAGLLKIYKGRAFSDMSCTTHPDELKNWAGNPKYGKDPDILSQTMFGSDFDVLYFTNIGNITLGQYNGYFVSTFPQTVLDQMMGDTPRLFLG